MKESTIDVFYQIIIVNFWYQSMAVAIIIVLALLLLVSETLVVITFARWQHYAIFPPLL